MPNQFGIAALARASVCSRLGLDLLRRCVKCMAGSAAQLLLDLGDVGGAEHLAAELAQVAAELRHLARARAGGSPRASDRARSRCGSACGSTRLHPAGTRAPPSPEAARSAAILVSQEVAIAHERRLHHVAHRRGEIGAERSRSPPPASRGAGSASGAHQRHWSVGSRQRHPALDHLAHLIDGRNATDGRARASRLRAVLVDIRAPSPGSAAT